MLKRLIDVLFGRMDYCIGLSRHTVTVKATPLRKSDTPAWHREKYAQAAAFLDANKPGWREARVQRSPITR